MNGNEALNDGYGGDAEMSPVLVSLMKGVLEQATDNKLWEALIKLQPRVRDYMATLGLELVLDEAEGYAFLRSFPDGDETPAPRLVARRPLSFQLSLLLALLRKKIVESDAAGGDTRLVLTTDEIAELFRVFLPQTTNETRTIDQVEAQINKAVDLGFLRKLKGTEGSLPSFEVRRILKAFVDAQWLADFDARLEEYRRLYVTTSGEATRD